MMKIMIIRTAKTFSPQSRMPRHSKTII
ncbi:unnamed protein product [Timema podura]|uniref:Uncharacterized protein n=1 Tax=Timema podura TaxID=61482 RepID=A0ABN7NSQ3_TIMPD|nr:unnamed protein product [Timema podura]